VIIMVVFIFASLSWLFSARHWFHGPIRTVEDLKEVEADKR
jgi:hypothetical protein